MRDRIEQPLAALVDSLREEFPELLVVYRFGGFGTEYERLAGDLDLAVYAGRDLVDLASASTVMRALG